MDRPPGDEKGGRGKVVDGAGDGSASLATMLSGGGGSGCFAVVPGRKQEQEQETLQADHADGPLVGSYQGPAVAALELGPQLPWTKGDDDTLVTPVHNPGCEVLKQKDGTKGLRKIVATHMVQLNESTNLDSWTPEQLTMMVYGGNNRAQAFFKQHGWTDGGKIEAKYTSRAADLYQQLLAKEVAKSSTEDGNNSWPSSLVAAFQASNQAELTEVSKENVSEKKEPEIIRSPRAPNHPFKNLIGAKKPGNKTCGLDAQKLSKPNESLFEQKPEEPAPVLPLSVTESTLTRSKPHTARFEYVENAPAPKTGNSSEDNHMSGHVASPKWSNFFAEFGIDSGYHKKSASSSFKVQIEESNEARQKVSNAKSISSSRFFGDQASFEKDVQVSLQKFSSSSAMSNANLFGHPENDTRVDISASDLIKRISIQDCLTDLRNMTSHLKPAADNGDSENKAQGVSGLDSLCGCEYFVLCEKENKVQLVPGPDSAYGCLLSTKTAAIGNVNSVGNITEMINDAVSLKKIWEQELSRQKDLDWLAIKEFFQSDEYHQIRNRSRNLETRTENSMVNDFHNEKATKENKTSPTKVEGIPVVDTICECTPSIKTTLNGNKGSEQKAESRNGACSLTQFFVKVCEKQISMLKDLNTTTVEEMIQSACHKAGIMPCDMFATYGGKRLKLKKSVACYPIFKDSTVQIRSRLRAGSIPTIKSETFDEVLSTNLGRLFYTINLSQLAINKKTNRTSVTFLSTFLAYHIRQILVFLCGRHRAGKSFDGKFESKDIIVLNRTFVMFDTSVTEAEVDFTEQSCSNDYFALYNILSSSTFQNGGAFPLYYQHFLDVLFTCPAKGNSNLEPFIQFLINHPALTSYTDRVKQCILLDSTVLRLHPSDYSNIDKVAGADKKWVSDVTQVTAMKVIYHYKAKVDQNNKLIVNGKYTTQRLGCLHFARNYFSHVHQYINFEHADAAFAEALEYFLPEFLKRIAIGHSASPAYVDILGLLANPLADSFSGQ